MTRIDRNSANTQIYAYEIKQSISKKILFAATDDAAIDGIAHSLLSCYHSKRLFQSCVSVQSCKAVKSVTAV